MKIIIYLFFLLIAAVFAADGQTLTPRPLVLSPLVAPKQTGRAPLELPSLSNSLLVPEDNSIFTPPGNQLLFFSSKDPVALLRPDNMPCLIPDLARLERMPVNKKRSADRMPNGIKSAK